MAFDIEGVKAIELAERIANLTAGLGDPIVQLFGDGNKKIKRLGIGTGCCCRPDIFLEMGCDGAVVCDDGCWYWKDVSWACEVGLPLLRIGHGTSEEPGMAALAEYINGNLPGVSAEHYKLSLGVTYVGSVDANEFAQLTAKD